MQKIAERAYGPDASYVTLHEANRALIGRNASQLEIGMTIEVPCLSTSDELIAPEAEAAAAELRETATGAPQPVDPARVMNSSRQIETATSHPASDDALSAPSASTQPLRVVAAGGWAPFLDEKREKGGMIAEILSTALSRVMSPDEFRIDFINDRAAHLDPLLTDLAYDVSLAWIRPDCDRIWRLGVESRRRCRNLVWSAPLLEQVFSYYTRVEEAAPADHRALGGRTLCRPETYSLGMMETVGLVEPYIELKRAATAERCFAMLLEGEVDAVVVATAVADEALTTLKATETITEQPQLATVVTLHAVTSIRNPRKAELIARIDEGLHMMREDGAWFEIVRRHLSAQVRRDGAGG